MNFVKWIVALAILFYVVPLQVQAAPVTQINETLVAGENYSNTFDITIENDLSLPYQISWSADPGVSLSFWLINTSTNAMLAFLAVPGTIIMDALAKGTYRLFVSATNNDTLYDKNMTGKFGAVPIPASIILLGTGLIGLVGVSRRKSHTT